MRACRDDAGNLYRGSSSYIDPSFDFFIFGHYFSLGGCIYVSAQLATALPIFPQLSTSFFPSFRGSM